MLYCSSISLLLYNHFPSLIIFCYPWSLLFCKHLSPFSPSFSGKNLDLLIMAAGPYYSSLLFNKVNPFPDETDGHSRELQNVAFLTCLGLTACLVWNSGSVAFLWMVGGVESKTLFLALFYLVCGLPAANWLWFRPLCRALRTENTSMFRCFFLFYQLHIAFCIFAAVSPPIIARGRSLTGILSASDIYGDYGEIGYLYFIGFAWFSLESVLSIWVLQKVYKFYRLGGLALEMV